jgi:glutathione S-transferase
MYTLVSTETSPYGRKARIAIDVLGLSDEVALRPANTRDPADPLRELNPLGKMPVLLQDDGPPVFDSRVIIEHLETKHGNGRIVPRDAARRARILTLSALADGILDALLLVTYERRFREEDQVSQVWLDHQMGKIRRGMDAAVRLIGEYEPPTVASISLACALGYADWRKQLDWRDEFPALADWLETFAAAVPAWEKTKAA